MSWVTNSAHPEEPLSAELVEASKWRLEGPSA